MTTPDKSLQSTPMHQISIGSSLLPESRVLGTSIPATITPEQKPIIIQWNYPPSDGKKADKGESESTIGKMSSELTCSAGKITCQNSSPPVEVLSAEIEKLSSGNRSKVIEEEKYSKSYNQALNKAKTIGQLVDLNIQPKGGLEAQPAKNEYSQALNPPSESNRQSAVAAMNIELYKLQSAEALRSFRCSLEHRGYNLFTEETTEFKESLTKSETNALAAIQDYETEETRAKIEQQMPRDNLPFGDSIKLLCFYNFIPSLIGDPELITVSINNFKFPFVKVEWSSILRKNTHLWCVELQVSNAHQEITVSTKVVEGFIFRKLKSYPDITKRSLLALPYQYLFDVICTKKEGISPLSSDYSPMLYFDYILKSQNITDFPSFFNQLSRYEQKNCAIQQPREIMQEFRELISPIIRNCKEILVYYAFAIIGFYDKMMLLEEKDRELFHEMLSRVSLAFNNFMSCSNIIAAYVKRGLVCSMKLVSIFNPESILYVSMIMHESHRKDILQMMVDKTNVGVNELIVADCFGLFANYDKIKWKNLCSKIENLNAAFQLLEICKYKNAIVEDMYFFVEEKIQQNRSPLTCKAILIAFQSKSPQFLTFLKASNAIKNIFIEVFNNPHLTESKHLDLYRETFSGNYLQALNIEKEPNTWYANMLKSGSVPLKAVLEAGLPTNMKKEIFATYFIEKPCGGDISVVISRTDQQLAECSGTNDFLLCCKAFSSQIATFDIKPDKILSTVEAFAKLKCTEFAIQLMSKIFICFRSNEAMKIIFDEKGIHPEKESINKCIAMSLEINFRTLKEIEESPDAAPPKVIYVPFEPGTKELTLFRHKWYHQTVCSNFELIRFNTCNVWKLLITKDKTDMEKFQLRKSIEVKLLDKPNSYETYLSAYDKFINYGDAPIRFVCSPPFDDRNKSEDVFVYKAFTQYIILILQDYNSFSENLSMLLMQLPNNIGKSGASDAQIAEIINLLDAFLQLKTFLPDSTKMNILVVLGYFLNVEKLVLGHCFIDLIRNLVLDLNYYKAEHLQTCCLRGIAKVIKLNFKLNMCDWQPIMESLNERQHFTTVLTEFFTNESQLTSEYISFFKQFVMKLSNEDIQNILFTIFCNSGNFTLILEAISCVIAKSIDPTDKIVKKIVSKEKDFTLTIKDIDYLMKVTRENPVGMKIFLSRITIITPLKEFFSLNSNLTEANMPLIGNLYSTFKPDILYDFNWKAFKEKLIQQRIRISTVLLQFNESESEDIDLFEKWLSIPLALDFCKKITFFDTELRLLEAKPSHPSLCCSVINHLFGNLSSSEWLAKAQMFDEMSTELFREKFILIFQQKLAALSQDQIISFTEKIKYPKCKTLHEILSFILTRAPPLQLEEIHFKLFSEPHLQYNWKIALEYFNKRNSFIESLLNAFREIRKEIDTETILVKKLMDVRDFNPEKRKKFMFYLTFGLKEKEKLAIEKQLTLLCRKTENLEFDFQQFNDFCSYFGGTLFGAVEIHTNAELFWNSYPTQNLQSCALPHFIEVMIPTVKKVYSLMRTNLFKSLIFSKDPLTSENICEKCTESFEEVVQLITFHIKNISTLPFMRVIKELKIKDRIEEEINILKLILPGFDSEFYHFQESLQFYIESQEMKRECEGLLAMQTLIEFSDSKVLVAANNYLSKWPYFEQKTVAEYTEINKCYASAIYQPDKNSIKLSLRVICKMNECSKVIKFLIEKCPQEMIDQLKEGVSYYSESSVDLKSVVDMETLLHFYTEVKAENSKFTSLAHKINLLITGERFREIEKVMNRCQDILNNVLDVLVLMNSMEKAKQQQIVAIFENSMIEIVQTPDKRFDIKLICNVFSIKYELNAENLLGLRDRALITMYNSKDVTKADEFQHYGKFCEFSDTIFSIIAAFDQLHICGYPVKYLYKEQKYHCIAGEFSRIENFKKNIDCICKEWESTLRRAYGENHLLTFFYGQQFWCLEEHFPECRSLKGSSLLEYIGLHEVAQSAAVCQMEVSETLVQVEPSLMTVSNRLSHVGSHLTDREARCLVPRFKAKTIPSVSALGEITKQPGSILLVISSTTLHSFVSMYLLTQRPFPEFHQVLFCTEKTSGSEILAFVYRFFTDPIKNLYSLVSCENLSTENQVLFLELFEQLIVKGGHLFQLAIISSVTRGYIVNFFQRSKITEVVRVKDGQRIHTDDELGKIVKSIDKNTFVYSSKRAGFGKSTQINLRAKELGKEVLKLSIAGDLNMDEICEFLLKKMSKDKLLHINLGYVENYARLNQFLMDLSLFRIAKSDEFIVCLPKDCIICIELPNLQPSLAESLPYLKHLQCSEVKFKFELIVSEEIQQLLSQYPDLSQCCTCIDHSHSPITSQVDLLKCLFIQTISNEPQSFIRFQSFLKVLVVLLQNLKESPFSNEIVNEMIQDLKRGCVDSDSNSANLIAEYQMIRRTIVESFLETTKEVTETNAEEISQMQSAALSKVSSIHDFEAKHMEKSWNSTNHFVNLVLEDGFMLPIYKRPEKKTDDVIPTNIKKLIFFQSKSDEMTGWEMAKKIRIGDFHIDYYENFTSEQLCEKLFVYCSHLDSDSNFQEFLNIRDKEYVLTPDNFLKMNLIYIRAMAKLPIIITGETGCGKTSLIRFFVNNVLRERLHIVRIHAGFDSKQLYNEIESIKKLAQENDRIWAFFDEFNTSVCIGQICEILCENTFLGEPLPDNIVMLGACNPYRKKRIVDNEEVGIKKAQKYVNDLANTLVHLVKPLPETMIEFVWDFGALNKNDTEMYISAMLKQLKLNVHLKLLMRMLNICQSHWKKIDPSSVSLRDVKRFILLYEWFYRSLEFRKEYISSEYRQNIDKLKLTIDQQAIQDLELSAGILALCYCYYLRISKQEERDSFLKEMAAASTEQDRITDDIIKGVLKFNENDILARMKLPEGIALNSAFRENICTLLPCIYSGIAIFICGKPGCSKSLAVQVLFDNCKGKNSVEPYLNSLPELIRVNFQGSESCTSEGIENIFKKAQKILEADKIRHLPVIVFDEIGLAEISPHNPLKVLHSKLELENRDIAFIGISNWRLDASKMNRALYLARPEPREEELRCTALNIIEAVPKMNCSQQHRDIINALADAYSEFRKVLKNTPFKEFYGLRDFYNLIKLTVLFFKAQPNQSCEKNAILCKTAIMRNFGGLLIGNQGEINYSDTFFQLLKKKYNLFNSISDQIAYYSAISQSFEMKSATALDLIKENMRDELSRYLMIISKDDTALFVLERVLQNIPSEKKIVVVGSHMPDDDGTEEYGFSSLSSVLLHMENDTTLILKDMDHIYTALYDLFNQNFSRSGSRNYCRVAIGAQFNPRCFVHDGFRVVILMDNDLENLTQTDAPFLNRFEKQRFSLDMLVPQSNPLLQNLAKWMQQLMTPIDSSFKPIITESQVFPLYTEDYLKLLVLFSDERAELDNRVQSCKEKLIKIASADFLMLCKLSSLKELEQHELIKQWHELHNLHFDELIESCMRKLHIEPIKLVVFTFDNSTQFKTDKHVHKHFSLFHTEREFIYDLKNFMRSENVLYILEVNLDSSNSKHLTFIKFTIDNIVKEKRVEKIICLLVRLRRVAKAICEGCGRIACAAQSEYS